jgi:hypothetical protein
MLNRELAKPETISRIREFGQGMADAFDKAITFAERVPWSQIGQGLAVAADWAGKLVGAFASLPAEAQGILLGLAGLTKLTGGAPIKIAVDLAQGLLGQFFGRGSSPAAPMYTKEVGLGGGLGSAVGGGLGKGKAGMLGIGMGLLGGLGIAVMLAGIASEIEDDVQNFANQLHDALDLPDVHPETWDWPLGPRNTPKIDIGPFKNILGGDSPRTLTPGPVRSSTEGGWGPGGPPKVYTTTDVDVKVPVVVNVDVDVKTQQQRVAYIANISRRKRVAPIASTNTSPTNIWSGVDFGTGPGSGR